MLNLQSVLRNYVTSYCVSTVSLIFVWSRVCDFLYSLGPMKLMALFLALNGFLEYSLS